MNRPAMQEMLHYIDKHPHKNYTVIFDDLKRFARDTVFHLKLRAALQMRNVKPECLNYVFDDSPEGTFVETIFAAQGQLEREQNRRQVIQKQKARLEQGYWPFYPPPGYQQVREVAHGKVLRIIEPEASLIREAFEGFASDRFMTQADVARFLQDSNYNKGRPVYVEGVRRLLRRVVYAGYVEREEWEVSRRPGQHKGLVSIEVFQKVQEKLDGKCKVRSRLSDRMDFALRGLLLCDYCNKTLTGSWSRGRNKMYRYYRCKTSTCVRFNKSVNGDFVDREFKTLLRSAVPRIELLELAKRVLIDLWGKRVKLLDQRRIEVERKIEESSRQVDLLTTRITRTMDESLIYVYERQILKARDDSIALQGQLKTIGLSAAHIETALEVVTSYLKDPVSTWENGDLKAKRLVFGLVFADKLVFHHKDGFETAQKPLITGLFEQISTKESQDVEVGRVELPSSLALRAILRRVVGIEDSAGASECRRKRPCLGP